MFFNTIKPKLSFLKLICDKKKSTFKKFNVNINNKNCHYINLKIFDLFIKESKTLFVFEFLTIKL